MKNQLSINNIVGIIANMLHMCDKAHIQKEITENGRGYIYTSNLTFIDSERTRNLAIKLYGFAVVYDINGNLVYLSKHQQKRELSEQKQAERAAKIKRECKKERVANAKIHEQKRAFYNDIRETKERLKHQQEYYAIVKDSDIRVRVNHCGAIFYK